VLHSFFPPRRITKGKSEKKASSTGTRKEERPPRLCKERTTSCRRDGRRRQTQRSSSLRSLGKEEPMLLFCPGIRSPLRGKWKGKEVVTSKREGTFLHTPQFRKSVSRSNSRTQKIEASATRKLKIILRKDAIYGPGRGKGEARPQCVRKKDFTLSWTY